VLAMNGEVLGLRFAEMALALDQRSIVRVRILFKPM